MFNPSTAPRWKIAISSLRRAPAASTVRARNDGAKPSVTIANPLDFKNTRRVTMVIPCLLLLELGRPDCLRLSRRQCQREVDAIDERARRYPRIGGLGIAGRRLAQIQWHPHLGKRTNKPLRLAEFDASGTHRAHDELERRLHLRESLLAGKEFG